MTLEEFCFVILSCGTPLFIEFIFLIDSRTTSFGNPKDYRTFKTIVVAGVLQSLFYATEHIVFSYDYFNNLFLGTIVNCLIYFGNMFYIYAYANFVYSLYAKGFKKQKLVRILYFIPSYILIILCFVNIFTPVYFYLAPQTFEYIEKPFVNLINFLPLGYIVFSLFFDIKTQRKSIKYNTLFVSLYFAPTFVGIIIEALNPNLPAVPAFCSISIMLLNMRILKQSSCIDSLSGVYARPQMMIYINSLLEKKRSQKIVCGIMLDVNKFKMINDTYGHQTGNKAIQEIGQILKDVTRKKGLSFRYGGDEFVIIAHLDSVDELYELSNKLQVSLELFNLNKKEVFELSVSQGYSVYDKEKDTVVTFVERMDAEMYKNKRKLKN